MGLLDDKSAVITGAAGGIGLEIARRFHQEGAGLYCASKAAQQMLSQVMAMEVAEDNIRVNSILHGLVEDTQFLYNEIGQEHLPEFFETLRPLHPLGRNTKPKDIADAALFLASDQSDFISGILLNVDGGVIWRPTGLRQRNGLLIMEI